jgi:hypothetical protein
VLKARDFAPATARRSEFALRGQAADTVAACTTLADITF